MIPSPSEILSLIQSGSLLPPAKVALLDHDAILDQRDSDAFEVEWLRCCNMIERHWSDIEVDQEASNLLYEVRKESFLAVSRATAQHEIASYVSDDFDLIVRGSILGVSDPFLVRLWEAYCRHEIPGRPQ